MSTIFKRIINKEIDADIVYEDDLSLAFKDINAVDPTHILIIPKKEIATLNDIKDEDKEILGHLFIVAKKIASKIGLSDRGYRVVFNCNDDGGQSVYHIHMHLLGGRKLLWPPG